MASAVIIDIPDVLTDETDNERNAITLIRQIVATAGVRVSEQALQGAMTFAIESFAPNYLHAMIFKLVNRDTTLALRCISAFNKNFKPAIKLRSEAPQIVESCAARGWKLALAQAPTEPEAEILEKAGLLQQFQVKGTPNQMKISLPDARVLEFLIGALGTSPGDTVILGTRIDKIVRPGNILRMTTVQLQIGHHGKMQFPRDLRDVPDYEAPNIDALLNVIPTVV